MGVKWMPRSTSNIHPHKIVEDALRYIALNLTSDLRPRTIAKGIEVNIQELHGSYECATITTQERDILKIKIHSFHESIKLNPDEDVVVLAKMHGLQSGEELEQNFESEFWISISEHRESSSKNFWHRSTQRANQIIQ